MRMNFSRSLVLNGQVLEVPLLGKKKPFCRMVNLSQRNLVNLSQRHRLLRDGPLRDAYARDPLRTAECLGVPMEDRPELIALRPEDLEFQAEVLLRKRFEAISRLVPQTIANAGARGWLLFSAYAREIWPTCE